MAPKPTKLTKALKEMKKMGFSEKIVRPIVRTLLNTYDNNWALIEGDEYQVLVDAILDSEDKKTKDSELEQLMNAWSEDEDEEENKPLIKRPKRSDSKKGKSTFSEEHRNKDASCHVKQEKGSKVISDHDDDDDERDESKSIVPLVDLGSSGDESFDCISEKRMIVYEKGKRKKISKENDLALVEKVTDEHDEAAFEVPLAVVTTPDSPVLLLLQGSSQESFSTPKENISPFAEVMDLDAEDISPCLLLKEPYSVENSSDLEENHLEESTKNEKIEPEKNENGVQDSMNLDIASSSKGEVKISLTISSSRKPGLHISSLAALFEQAEEHCLKSYEIPRNNFSMSKLMEEVCESFLIAGTTSKYNEDVRTETVPAGEIVSNDPIKIQIPKFVGSIGLDLSRCKIYLSETERSIFELATKTIFLQNHFTSDITNGQESNEISLTNEVNEDQCPEFNYISKNVIYQNANVRFSLANISEQNCCSNCFGDCLSLRIPCNCAGKSDSEFAYTPGGVLKESFLDNFVLGNDFAQKHNLFYCRDCPLERPNDTKLSVPCNGHITRKFIKECWIKCRCSFNKCANRVVQRGITAKLQVFMTAERKGWGVRTLEEIPKGGFVCEYVGEVVTTKEQFGRDVRKNSGDSQTYSVLLDAGWSCKGILKDEDALCLDATVYGNVARFINHRCFDSNLVDIPVEVETPDHHYYRLAFFTKRKVNALEELTWDYGFDFNDNDFECRCGSKLCRDRKTSKRKLISL